MEFYGPSVQKQSLPGDARYRLQRVKPLVILTLVPAANFQSWKQWE